MSARVNVANGNLLLSATDLSIAGTGIDARIERSFNSLSTDADPNGGFGPGWSGGEVPTSRLEFPTATQVSFVGPSGYRARFDKVSGSYVRATPGIDARLSFDTASSTYRLLWNDKRLQVFTSAGRLERMEDKQGNAIRYSYDAAGALDYLTDTQGRRIDFTITGGLIEQITDVAGGRTFDYDYDQFGGDPTWRLASFAVVDYDQDEEDVNLDVETSYDYDADGRLVSVTDPMGNLTRIDYVAGTRQVAALTRVTEAAGEPDPATGYSYPGTPGACTSGTRSVVDAERVDVADTTTYCADTHARVTSSIDAKGHRRSTTYTPNSNVSVFNDSGGQPAYKFGWDTGDDNLVSITLPGPGTGSGGQARASYADTAQNPHLPTAVYDYANPGSTPASATWQYDYDPKGQLIEAKNTATGISYRYCYTGLGLLHRIDAPPVTTALDNDTTTGCGTANQGNDTLLSHDPDGNLTGIDPPGPHGSKTFTHDPVGRVATMTDGRGVVTTYSYDALDRVTRLEYSNTGRLPGFDQVEYVYDTNGNQLTTDLPGSTGSGDTVYHYDELNRTIEVSTQLPVWETEYSYDPAGNLVGLDGSDEPDVTYGYDNMNRLASVLDQKGRTTSFGYNAQDQRTTTVYPNGVTEKQRFDEAKRLTCVYAHTGTPPALGANGCPAPSTALHSFFGYDYLAGTRGTTTRRKVTNRNNATTTYSYDEILRLKRATEKTAGGTGTTTRDHAYTLDGRGNITRETVTGTSIPNTTTSLAYNDAAELCWTATGSHTPVCGTPPTGATSHGYDNDGNLTTSSAGLSAGYSSQGQTAQVTPPGGNPFDMAYSDVTSDTRHRAGTLQMSHSMLGLAAQGPLGGTHSDWFLRDPDGKLIAMLNRDDDTNDRYYLFDGLGSVAATTDTTGTVASRYTYTPYGKQTSPDPTLTDTNGDPLDRNPYRFAAGYYDTPTGMLKYGTRYYQPDLMRWTQTDPVAGQPENPMTLNPYTYVGANPANAVDPSGLSLEGDLSRLIGSILGSGVGATTGGLLAGPSGAVVGACIGATYGYTVGDLAAGDEGGTAAGALLACPEGGTVQLVGLLNRTV
jgi:RHS repeat-associated protein